MMTLPNGEQRFPSFDSRFYGELGPARQFQIVQTSPQNLELHVVVDRALSASEEAEIKKLLCRNLQQEFAVEIVLRDSIPRGPGGKYEEFICVIER